MDQSLPPRKTKAVIFDFDDTVCMTGDAGFQIENEVAISLGFAPMPWEVHKQTWGNPLSETYDIRIPGVPKEAYLKQVIQQREKWTQEGKTDVLEPEILQMMDNLRNAGYVLGIVTSREYSECKHLLDAESPLNNRINYFHYREKSPYVKPNPRVFEEALQILAVDPEEALYIGDSMTDAKAANGAGIPFIATLESGLRSKEDFSEYRVEQFIYSLTELEKLLC
jgi:phosphoglycolate phosphatase